VTATLRAKTAVLVIACAVIASLGAGCGARSELPECRSGQKQACQSICGDGVQLCVDDRWLPCNAQTPEDTIPLATTVRDFKVDHPDFESDTLGDDHGIVQKALGIDGKPVYAGMPSTPTTTGKLEFDQWFHDVVGINLSTPYTLTLSPEAGEKLLYGFDSSAFFPIDGQLFGNEGYPHNFHFTLELHVDFRYSGGETFTFRGDDDVFVFINERLAIDLGGVHSAESATVDLDASAADLGLTPGEVYPLALFFAERHTDGSNFHVETTISELRACPK
jgi:fibro-slime domain-containing protein